MFFKLYTFLDKIDLFRYLMDILSRLYRLRNIKPLDKDILVNLEGIKNMNIDYNWFTTEKPLGISGVARLKNADDFLEKVLESHIPFLDELILVDNLSNDKTKTICLKIQEKYPDKVKFYDYDYEVYPPGTNKNILTNSIHSLAYYYNWSFSKSTYSHVMKIDDDNLLIANVWGKFREKILNSNKNNFFTFYGLNLIKKNHKIGVCKSFEFSGKYGDIGIYKTSPYTYYIQGYKYEYFQNNYAYKRLGLGYFHLKFLKKEYGLINLKEGKFKQDYIKKIKSGIETDLYKYTKKIKINTTINKIKELIN